jgi:hypothetical protein
MASFTDQISQFNPYIQELPVQEMVQVGMQKQAQYNQGVQKIQNQIDRVAGMDIIKDVDRQHLQSKLNELGSRLKTVAAGDFSNQQLVNSVAGMTGQIAKDETIQNAVYSTAHYKKEIARLQKDVDAGKSSPDNITNFQKKANTWLSSTTPGEKFNGSYTPYFDISKFAKEQFDAVKIKGWSSDKIFEYNPDGSYKREKILVTDTKGKPVLENGKPKYTEGAFILSPYMIREEREGRLPEEVKATINTIFSDPRVRQQLQITGEYNLAGVNEEGLVELINGQRDNNLIAYEDLINELSLRKNLEKDENNKKLIDERIEQVSGKMKDVTKTYAEYAQEAMSNPDAIRGKIYSESMTNNLTQMYGSVSKSIKVENNPGYEMRFKELQEATRIAQFNANLKKDYYSLAQTVTENEKNRAAAKELKLMDISAKGVGGKGAGVGNNALDNIWERGEIPSDMDIVGDFKNKIAGAADKMLASGYDLVWNSVIGTLPQNINALGKLMNTGKTREEAIKILVDNTAAKARQTPDEFLNYWTSRTIDKVNATGKIDPNIQDSYSVYKRAQRDFSDFSNQNKSYDDEVSKQVGSSIVDKINKLDIKPIPVKYKGKDFEVSKEDLSDLAIYMRGYQSLGGVFEGTEKNKQAKQAEQRLIGKGKEFLLESGVDLFAGGPSSRLVRAFKVAGKSIPQLFGSESPYIQDEKGNPIKSGREGYENSRFGKSLKQVYDIVGTEDGEKALIAKSALIKNKGFTTPNLKSDLKTGKNEVDQKTLGALRNYASEYSTNGNNLAGATEIKNILSALGGDIKDLSIEGRIIKGSSGEPVTSVRVRNFATNIEGTMILPSDEALNVGMDVSTAYEPELITNIRNKIKFSTSSATSAGPANVIKTYTDGDTYFDGVEDFPQLKGSPFDAKGNILQSSSTGLYYGYVYGKNKATGKEGLEMTDGYDNLSELVGRMKTINPQFIQNFLK